MRYTVIKNVIDSKRLPADRNAVTIESGTPSGQPTVYLAAILQVHGRVLDALYLQSAAQVTAAETKAITTLATLSGTRLVSSG